MTLSVEVQLDFGSGPRVRMCLKSLKLTNKGLKSCLGYIYMHACAACMLRLAHEYRLQGAGCKMAMGRPLKGLVVVRSYSTT